MIGARKSDWETVWVQYVSKSQLRDRKVWCFFFVFFVFQQRPLVFRSFWILQYEEFSFWDSGQHHLATAEVRVLDAGVAGVDVQVLQDANSQEQAWFLDAWGFHVTWSRGFQGNIYDYIWCVHMCALYADICCTTNQPRWSEKCSRPQGNAHTLFDWMQLNAFGFVVQQESYHVERGVWRT